MTRHRDDRAQLADDSHEEQGGMTGADPMGPRSGGGEPTGETQAAANREVDPPA